MTLTIPKIFKVQNAKFKHIFFIVKESLVLKTGVKIATQQRQMSVCCLFIFAFFLVVFGIIK